MDRYLTASWKSLKAAFAGLPPAWGLAVAAAAVAFVVTVVALRVWRAATHTRREGRGRRSQVAYIQGLSEMLSGQTARAVESLSRAVKLDGDNVDAYLRLGTLFRIAGQPGRAIRVHKSLLMRPTLPDEVAVNALYELGLDYRSAGDLVKAAEALNRVTSLEAKHVLAHKELRAIYEEGRRWDEALAAEKKLLRLTRSKDQEGLASLHLASGRELFDKGEVESSIESFRKAAELNPQSVGAHLALGDTLFSSGQTEAAIAAWERLINDSPGHFPYVLERLERAYFNLGQFDDLRGVFLRYLEAHPDDTTVRLALAEFYIRRGRMDEAGKELKLIGEDSLGSIKANLHLARIYKDENRDEAAWKARIEAGIDTAGVLARTFQCGGCMATQREYFWSCPSCNRLESARPATPTSGP